MGSRRRGTRFKLPAILVFNRDAKNTGNAGNAVVGEADDQPGVGRILIGPDKGRAHTITDATMDAIEGGGKGLIVVGKILRADLVKIPERPVIRANVHDVRDHVFGGRDTIGVERASLEVCGAAPVRAGPRSMADDC